MEKDNQPKQAGGLKVVSVVGRARKGAHRDWVKGDGELPIKEVLEETLLILECITGLSQKALEKPSEAKALMRATYYLSGMAKAMVDAQLPGLIRQMVAEGEARREEAEPETE
ncbi:hypothetical protein J2W83_000824 [Pseudomonas hunanensis]|uniref:Uncharacterized protein n=1 Tax=Pseudomonas hunanensis TaxID=1247546 RepID=A0ACC6JYJ1_9PSED|nr:DUF3077 domain-containing protein [Pseudomonas hunanensis]MDR6711234.1 hypothetical protein [Pseudomonas hunanensis]